MRGRGDPPGDPNHTQAMHYKRNWGWVWGHGGGSEMRLQKNGTMRRRTEEGGEMGRGPKGTASDFFYRLSSDKHHQASIMYTCTVYF